MLSVCVCMLGVCFVGVCACMLDTCHVSAVSMCVHAESVLCVYAHMLGVSPMLGGCVLRACHVLGRACMLGGCACVRTC